MSDFGPDTRRVERLVEWLTDWADWNRGYSVKTGFPPKACGLSSGYVSATFDEMCDSSDMEVFAVIDAVIDDLGRENPAQKAAIMRRYLQVSWSFPRGNYEDALLSAHVWLLETLPARGVMV